MLRIDVALDDYLHQIVRTRPWTKKREEALLTAFLDWLYAQPHASAYLDTITPVVSARYVREAGLSAREGRDLTAALYNLFAWAEQGNRVQTNPFATLTMA